MRGRTQGGTPGLCLRNAPLWLLPAAVFLGLLWVSGAFQAEFGEYPDEASHYVTSLMVRDYVLGGAGTPPLPFALDYYNHYPRVALGHYPPFLYVTQAAWMLAFPDTRASLLVLNSMLVALTGVLLYRTAREEFGRWAGAGLGLLWVGLPLVQTYGGMVMAEALVTLLVFAAVITYGRYLEHAGLRHALAFGLLSTLAILTKQVALYLGLLPLLAVPLGRRFGLLRRGSFWAPAVVVAAVAGSWYLFVHLLLLQSQIAALAGHTLGPVSLARQGTFLTQSIGWALTGLMVLGLWSHVIRPWARGLPVSGLWAACGGCLGAFLLFRVPAPVLATEDRHLMSVLPVVLLFAAAGIAWLSGMLAGRGLDRPGWAAVLALATGAAFLLGTFRVPHRRYHGFSEAASVVLDDPGRAGSVSLVCADASGEGAFVAAVAAGDGRSGHQVLRANKALAATNWNGTEYTASFQTPQELQGYLEGVPVTFLVVQDGPGPPGHLHWSLVREVLRGYPDRWSLAGSFPKLRPPSEAGAGVRLYRLNGPGQRRAPVKVNPGSLRKEAASG